MFMITNTFEIRMNRGDSSGAIPLVLNTGTSIEPIQYTFGEDLYIGGQTSSKFKISLNKPIFRQKCPADGLYSFYYLHNNWLLNNNVINLSDYGISCIGELNNEDAFSIIQLNQESDLVRFYILDVNTPLENWLVRKTFYKSGEVISEYANSMPQKQIYPSNLDSNGNFLIRLIEDDTDWLEAGEYNYLVQTVLTNKVTKEVLTNTVVNRRPFYVIDDDFDRRWE